MPAPTILKSFVVMFLLLTFSAFNFAQTTTADRIIIEKSARTMKLMRRGEILKTYKVALSRVPVGAKERTGDHKVPEGVISSIRKISRAVFILLCTSRIQMRRIASAPTNWESPPAATSKSTA